MAGYAVARPASESYFLEYCGPEKLPWAWIAVALTALAVTATYNRYSTNVDLGKLFAICAFTSLALLVGLILLTFIAPVPAAFALYVWKDVYVVVLVEVFWTFANAHYPLHTARWIYGMFLASGACGGLVGNFGVGPLAKQIGTLNALWLLVPVLLVTGIAAAIGMHGVIRPSAHAPAAIGEGFKRVLASKYLLLIVALVGVIQLVLTLIDYQFNAAVALAYPVLDERTDVVGRIYGIISIFEVFLQLSSGLFLRYLGVTATLVGIPIVLAAAFAASVAVPVFSTMAGAKVASKALDYSLTRATKELLYIPLPYAERAQGKAIIDVLVYRTSKGGVSLLLLAVGAALVTPLIGVLIGAWLVVAVTLARHFNRLTQQTQGGTDN
jgi:AAA family ATP:ADP antiporter